MFNNNQCFKSNSSGNSTNQKPRVLTADKNPAYPSALNQLKNKVDLNKKQNSDKSSISIIS